MLEELYEGTGYISLFDKSYRAYVILRPNNGNIVVKIQYDGSDGLELFKKVREGGFFGREHKLESLEIITPLGKIYKESLSLYPVLVNPGPSSIFDSSVLRIAYSSHAGIATFVFRPKDSFLVFEGETEYSLEDGSYYELLLLGFRQKILPGIKLDLEDDSYLIIQAGGENKSFSSGKRLPNFQGNFVLVRSDLDLFEPSIRDNLYKVLSLLNGSKVSLALGYALTKNGEDRFKRNLFEKACSVFYKVKKHFCFWEEKRTFFSKRRFKVAFSFSTDSHTGFNGVGTPFKVEDPAEYLDLVKTFIKNYLSYVRRIEKTNKRRFELFVEYFIEGISVNAILESKLITLYTALEIMDGADTLTKDSLKKAYGLGKDEAEFFVRLRNEVVHNGLSVHEALKKIPNDVRSKSKGRRNLDISFLAEKKDLACYLFLVCMLYKKLLNLIGADDLVKKLNFDLCV
jgi:hypothetical protein